jgi:hypothetical protein
VAADASTLVARYPEFQPALDQYPDMVDACLAQAEVQIDRTVYRDKADAAVHALAAHLLALCPLGGEPARLEPESMNTIYWGQYKALRQSLRCGMQVI